MRSNSVHVDIDRLRAHAVEFHDIGDQAQQTVDRLREVMARTAGCWGDDIPGKAFERYYLPDADNSLAAFHTAARSLHGFGTQLTDTASSFDAGDRDGADLVANTAGLFGQTTPSAVVDPPAVSPATPMPDELSTPTADAGRAGVAQPESPGAAPPPGPPIPGTDPAGAAPDGSTSHEPAASPDEAQSHDPAVSPDRAESHDPAAPPDRAESHDPAVSPDGPASHGPVASHGPAAPHAGLAAQPTPAHDTAGLPDAGAEHRPDEQSSPQADQRQAQADSQLRSDAQLLAGLEGLASRSAGWAAAGTAMRASSRSPGAIGPPGAGAAAAATPWGPQPPGVIEAGDDDQSGTPWSSKPASPVGPRRPSREPARRSAGRRAARPAAPAPPSTAEVIAALVVDLARRHRLVPVGFDTPDLAEAIVRGFLMAVDDVLSTYPPIGLRWVTIDRVHGPAAVRARWHPNAAEDGTTEVAISLALDVAVATDAGRVTGVIGEPNGPGPREIYAATVLELDRAYARMATT